MEESYIGGLIREVNELAYYHYAEAPMLSKAIEKLAEAVSSICIRLEDAEKKLVKTKEQP